MKQAQVLNKMVRLSHAQFAQRFLKIRDENFNVVPLVLSETQRKMDEVWERQEKTGKGIWIYLLKARQIYGSTYFTSRFFRKYWQTPGFNALIIADESKHADNLFDMFKRYYNEFPDKFRPKMERSNRKEVRFANWNSSMSIESAEKGDVARSGNYGGFLATEFPLWPHPDRTISGISAGVPRNGRTVCVLEGTASGMGYAHDLWEAAKRGDVEYEPLFIGWHEISKYRMRGNPVTDLDEEERTLKKVLQVDDDQLRWRRWAIANKCAGSLAMFHCDYPAFDFEPWIESGTPYFDLRVCRKALAEARQPSFIGRIERNTDGPQMVEVQHGYLQVWEMPEHDGEYIIGADVAGAKTGLKRDNDQSVACVFRVNPFKQVATLCYNTYEDIYARDLAALGTLYNNALIAVERNGIGRAVVQVLRDIYDNLYSMEFHDKWQMHFGGYPGWETSAGVRDELIAKLSEMIRTYPHVFRDSRFWNQAINFVLKNGRYEAANGHHDDFVFACGIAVQVFWKAQNIKGRIINPTEETARHPLLTLNDRFVYRDGRWTLCGPKWKNKHGVDTDESTVHRLVEHG